jgi:molybdopterin biosynthesis enzyme MoaB
MFAHEPIAYGYAPVCRARVTVVTVHCRAARHTIVEAEGAIERIFACVDSAGISVIAAHCVATEAHAFEAEFCAVASKSVITICVTGADGADDITASAD